MVEAIRLQAPAYRTAGDGSLAGVIAMVLVTVLGAHVAVRLPFTPVPVTLQVFGVLLSGLVLRPRQALATQLAYVGGGALGIPWLAGGAALPGTVVLTAGYLAGFVVAAPLVSRVRTRAGAPLAALLGVGVVHLAGTLFLGLVTGSSPWQAFLLGSAPFLPLDGLKALAAAAVARTLVPRD